MRVDRDVPLAPLTSLRLGGPARHFAAIDREPDIADALHWADGAGEPAVVLGSGTNVVVSDEGFPGVVLRMALLGVSAHRDAARVVVDVGAGEDWSSFVAQGVAEGWSGLAPLSGIPGLVGATPIQNVGAYGADVSELVVHVRAYDRALGGLVEIPAAECGFGYRTSRFKGSSRWVVASVRFAFDVGRPEVVRYAELARALSVSPGEGAPGPAVRDAVIALRRAKAMVLDQADPDSVSAGSFFVNPVVDAETCAEIARRAGASPPSFDAGEGKRKVAAAWLVERSGFPKGWGRGRAGVSRKHALALVNRGGATTRELLGVAREIQAGVKDRFGVALEPEPVLVGCSWQEEAL